MWAGNLAISSGLWALESPTLGKGGNRDPWEKLGVGQGGRGCGIGDGTTKAGRTQSTQGPVVCDGTFIFF